ncbi:dephospho-CoA kinase [Spirulina sp. CCNP1310]|uniref:dephospho-CoA kinase n=1 Tax=Spirulina sp. CCNP1310 TaxID=3110249 RepID=UPI002B1EA9F2|nr:dephospho-CoA kinase [Spirulina sp. CCNP1310]MEA5419957.1 dephospho-CoA kinase [Spirulina sp. CCNP1310]
MQRRIGLTGGISTGKSTVADYLANRYGLPVFDADQAARQAVMVGSPVWERVRDRYGHEILLPDGEINRRKLGEIVFSDPAELRWLEGEIHPVVGDRLAQTLTTWTDQPRVILMIPLLFEANMTDLVSEIWVVTCDPAQQQQRLIERDRLTTAQAQARINQQMPLAAKIAAADQVLHNTGTLAELYGQIDQALGEWGVGSGE